MIEEEENITPSTIDKNRSTINIITLRKELVLSNNQINYDTYKEGSLFLTTSVDIHE